MLSTGFVSGCSAKLLLKEKKKEKLLMALDTQLSGLFPKSADDPGAPIDFKAQDLGMFVALRFMVSLHPN